MKLQRRMRLCSQHSWRPAARQGSSSALFLTSSWNAFVPSRQAMRALKMIGVSLYPLFTGAGLPQLACRL